MLIPKRLICLFPRGDYLNPSHLVILNRVMGHLAKSADFFLAVTAGGQMQLASGVEARGASAAHRWCAHTHTHTHTHTHARTHTHTHSPLQRITPTVNSAHVRNSAASLIIVVFFRPWVILWLCFAPLLQLTLPQLDLELWPHTWAWLLLKTKDTS